jgi:hypothetical protein
LKQNNIDLTARIQLDGPHADLLAVIKQKFHNARVRGYHGSTDCAVGHRCAAGESGVVDDTAVRDVDANCRSASTRAERGGPSKGAVSCQSKGCFRVGGKTSINSVRNR